MENYRWCQGVQERSERMSTLPKRIIGDIEKNERKHELPESKKWNIEHMQARKVVPAQKLELLRNGKKEEKIKKVVKVTCASGLPRVIPLLTPWSPIWVDRYGVGRGMGPPGCARFSVLICFSVLTCMCFCSTHDKTSDVTSLNCCFAQVKPSTLL